METEDLINIPASSSSVNGSENDDLHSSLPINSRVKEDKLNGEVLRKEAEIGNEDSQPLLAADNDKDLVDSVTILQVSVELTEEVELKEKMNCFSSANGFLTVQDGSPQGNHKRDGSPISFHAKDGSSISGVKRPRVTIDEHQPSVHVVYDCLPRESKRKLEKLLQQWSEWHARHYPSSHDSDEVLEFGEETYFPALCVGLDKPSAVSFWLDNQIREPQSKEFVMLDGDSVPLYDRGYSLGLTPMDGSSDLGSGMEIVDASRCFNCGSYNHSLKECPKPRDKVAVNSARKEHNSRRNQNASSRNPTRYYQSSPGGKFDGLKPGVLDAETRRLLGLGKLDPPPWLNRMREMGYPPGYLDPEDEDQPSGITIFAEDGSKEEKEDGEILDTDSPEPPRKMSVEFPGINAPVPEKADERRWAAELSSFNLSRNRSHRSFNHSSEPTSKGHCHEQRGSRDFRDEGPPGVDPVTGPYVNSYSPRYGSYDASYSSYSPRGNIPIPRSPTYERSLSDRGRRSPLVHETSVNHGSYSSLPFSPPNRLLSPQSYGSGSLGSRDGDRWNSSSHYKDRRDEHLHQSRR